jgi:hypothetical protein
MKITRSLSRMPLGLAIVAAVPVAAALVAPMFDTLSSVELIKHVAALAVRMVQQRAASAESGPPIAAPFFGNQTLIVNPSSNMLALQRQSNCSLTLFGGTFTLAPVQ